MAEDTANPNAWTPDKEQRAIFARMQAEKEEILSDLTVAREQLRERDAAIKDLKAKLTSLAGEKGLNKKDNERRTQGVKRLVEAISGLQIHIAKQNTFEVLLRLNQSETCHLCSGKSKQHVAGCPLSELSPFQTKVFTFSTFDDDFDDEREDD